MNSNTQPPWDDDPAMEREIARHRAMMSDLRRRKQVRVVMPPTHNGEISPLAAAAKSVIDERVYLWDARKTKKRIHIADPEGRAFCQIENTGAQMNAVATVLPRDRKVCANCEQLEEEAACRAEPDLAVLMGEKMGQKL